MCPPLAMGAATPLAAPGPGTNPKRVPCVVLSLLSSPAEGDLRGWNLKAPAGGAPGSGAAAADACEPRLRRQPCRHAATRQQEHPSRRWMGILYVCTRPLLSQQAPAVQQAGN